MAAHALLIGTREVMARIVPLGAEQIAPGTDGFLQLRLEADEIYVKAGDRFILRTFSPMHTVAGGEILDAHPKKHRRFKDDVVTSLEARDAGLIDDVVAGFLCLRQVPFTQAGVIPGAVDLPLDKVEIALDHLRQAGIVRRTRQGYIHRDVYKAWQPRPCKSSWPIIRRNRYSRGFPSRSSGAAWVSMKMTGRPCCGC